MKGLLTVCVILAFAFVGNAQVKRSVSGTLMKGKPASAYAKSCGDYFVETMNPNVVPAGVRIGFIMVVEDHIVSLEFLKEKYRVAVDNARNSPSGTITLSKDATSALSGVSDRGRQALVFNPKDIEFIEVSLSQADLEKAPCLPKP